MESSALLSLPLEMGQIYITAWFPPFGQNFAIALSSFFLKICINKLVLQKINKVLEKMIETSGYTLAAPGPGVLLPLLPLRSMGGAQADQPERLQTAG